MTDFALGEADRMVRAMAHDFAAKEIRPVAADFDDREEFPWEVVKKGAALGLAGLPLGGHLGEEGITPLLMAEELSWGCAGTAIAMTANALAATALSHIATPEQAQRFLKDCMPQDGELRLGALALTEPDSGSDAGAMRTTAVRDGDEYVLNGAKRFITSGGIADLTVVFATENPGSGFGGVSAFAVPKVTPGLSETKVWKKMGIRASHTADIAFDDMRLPADHRLGPPDADFRSGGAGALGTLTATRPWIGALAVGVGRAAFEFSADYARERQQFGKPIIANEGVSFMLADMDIALDAARLLSWRAGWMVSRGEPMTLEEASKAKAFASDAAMKITIDAVQVCGGVAFTRELPLEKWMRDAKIFQIFEGTNQIQRLVIGRNIAGRAF
ncbi:MAG TPA: acyl-CoA dehydrogenase family protein [Dehalococcoidia bacterium]|nr:acyl-CoA dehydrogenase family protein [Dehalococcoidia bacterium]